MLQLIEANWIVFIAALLVGIAVAWWVFARATTVARPRERRPDALDEGASPAQRNQALIDAAPAAELVPPASAGLMAGIGEVIAVAAQDEVQEHAARMAEQPPAPSDNAPGDDLRRIKGIGPKLAAVLASHGVTRFDQIAGWTEEDIYRIDGQLGGFAGRPRRDNWVEQARLLASGDTAAYEAKFGQL